MSTDEKSKKKLKTSITAIILNALTTFITGIILIFIYLFLNANTVYLIKEAIPRIKKQLFPTNCSEPPFGISKETPCKKYITIVKEVQQGGAEALKETVEGLNKKAEVKLPYRWFMPGASNMGRSYLNWYLASLVHTQINMNDLITKVINHKYLTDRSNSILMLIIPYIVAILVVIMPFYTFFSLAYKQITSVFDYGIGALVLMICTWLLVSVLNIVVANVDGAITLFKLMIYPSFLNKRSEWPQIKNIMASQPTLLRYLFGYLFITILLALPLNKDYELPVKLIPLAFFIIMISIQVIKGAYNIIKTIL